MPAVDTLAAEIEKFMVPYAVPGPPTQTDPPELGWPNGTEAVPAPAEGSSPNGSSDGYSIKTAPITAGEYAGGYIEALPYWEGAEIASNTADTVVVSQKAEHPDGQQTTVVLATADGQYDYQLPGAPAVGRFTQVKRLQDQKLLAVNDGSAWHDPVSGKFSIHPPSPDILANDQLEVIWFKDFQGVIPAGTAYKLSKPFSPASAFTTGDAWSGAFEQYVYQGVPAPAPGTLAPATAAMKAVIDSMMIPGMFPAAISLAVLAFWGQVATSAALVWASLGVVTTFIPPPGAFAMGGAMAGAGVACLALGPGPGLTYTDWELQLPKDCAAVIAGAVNGASQGGQIMTQNGPAPVPVPFVLA